MGRAHTVLVIDDEEPIRRLVQRMLEPAVCRVLLAEDAETGLRAVQRGEPPVDAVLTDWIMAGLHGLDVVEVLDRHCPELPVAVISAYTSSIHPIVQDGGGIRILQKPFTTRDLQAAVAEMIRKRRDERRGGRAPVDLVDAAWELHHTRSA